MSPTSHWWDAQWAVRALIALDRPDAAVARAESCRGPWAGDTEVDALCDAALLAADRSGTRDRTLQRIREEIRQFPGAPTWVAEILRRAVDRQESIATGR